MKAVSSLPEHYREIYRVDFRTDKKLMLWVNAAGLLIMILMAIPAHAFIPIASLFDLSEGFRPYVIRMAVLIAASVAYIILHELVHGIAMKAFGTKKVRYGFTGLYAFAGSSDYYDRRSYITISLAPIAVWGVVCAILCAVVPESWFWVIYLIQIFNISGAAGDLYITFRSLKMPNDILVQDSGLEMHIYSAQ